ncbi:hypothetical protein CFP56_022643 [Quercus suber]|uniref:Uncharacterized protein n=1 Tax=Quercus suber TaxID=58331 RepID=A0AAW0LY24_QUESU
MPSCIFLHNWSDYLC